MNWKALSSAAFALLATGMPQAHADTYNVSFAGPGVSGSLALTYGSATDAKYPQAYEVTGISGTFTDTNIGITNATVLGLEPINYATPEPTNLLAPNDFSHFAVAEGLTEGIISYDNLLYPGGSPQTATDYPFSGGSFDIYGLLFDIGNGVAVNFWSNGVLPGSTAPDYGIAVVTHETALDYTGGVAPTPEPGSLVLLATGLLGVAAVQRRRFRRA